MCEVGAESTHIPTSFRRPSITPSFVAMLQNLGRLLLYRLRIPGSSSRKLDQLEAFLVSPGRTEWCILYTRYHYFDVVCLECDQIFRPPVRSACLCFGH